MKDITVIIPIHKLDDVTFALFNEAYKSAVASAENSKDFSVKIMAVVGNDVSDDYVKEIKNGYDIDVLINGTGKTDFCSQINYAVENIDTEYFSILEYDDTYSKIWFKSFGEYYKTNEDVSVFFPLSIEYDKDRTKWQYGNEMPLSNSFSNEIGMLDLDSLEGCFTMNLTGAVIKREDFINVGGYKSSIKVAFNYELLLRFANNSCKLMVVPKEGYYHVIGRDGSLTDEYNKTLKNDESAKWFHLAKREYLYKQDRWKTISFKKEPELK